jgi:hypothetical protein
VPALHIFLSFTGWPKALEELSEKVVALLQLSLSNDKLAEICAKEMPDPGDYP